MKDELRGALHVTALWALAVAGPLYDVLRRSAEFFVAYRAGRHHILLFVLIVSFAAPAALCAVVWLAGRLSAAAGRMARTVVVGVLVAVLAAQALQALSPPTLLHVGMAAGFGALAVALYASPAGRSFVTWLTPAILIFPLMFLFDRAIRPMVWPPHERAAVSEGPSTVTPIVFVIFDQLPLTSLLAPDGTIDRTAYPGFGELAATSTWFSRATTAGELTAWALPAIVSGRFAAIGQLPTAADYPYNLFTTFRDSYRMAVFEPITGLCPDAICPPEPAVRDAPRLRPMLADAGVVLAHRVVPPRLARGLPAVDESWKGFAEAQDFQRQWASERESDRRRNVENFLESIHADNDRSTLYFLHALLPHEPYEYLPSGQKSGRNRRLAGITFGGWTTDEFPVAQAYARELLQVRLVDRFVQRLMERLRSEGLFDDALVVVTSDHGVSFTPGHGMKGLSPETVGSILPIPLFVKRPHQTTGEVNERNVQSIDILPLVADVLDVALPFPTDGHSPLDTSVPAPDTKTVVRTGGRSQLTFTPDEVAAATSEAVARRVRWFGDGPGPYWMSRLAPAQSLIGRRIDTLDVAVDPSLRITLDFPEDVESVDPDAPIVPAHLSGRVRGSAGRSGPLPLAIAVNGRIEATTESADDVDGTPEGTWNALVNPVIYRRGFNDVRIYIVRGTGDDVRLVEGFRNEQP